MAKRKVRMYQCMTFFKQDISMLIQLFQENLQDVEIIMDGLPIIDVKQLEQFEPTYQATSLIARGFGSEMIEEDPRQQGERLHIELKLQKTSALFFVWNNVGQEDSEILVQIRKLLMRCQNRNHLTLTMFRGWMFLAIIILPPIAMLERVFKQPHVILTMQMFLTVGIYILLVLVTFLLMAYFGRVFDVEATIFLLPGMTETTHVYGRREAVGRLVIILVLVIVMGGFLFVLSTFWRNSNLEVIHPNPATIAQQQKKINAQATTIAQQQKKINAQATALAKKTTPEPKSKAPSKHSSLLLFN